MQIFHFNSVTGIFTGVGLADPDPLVEGGWLVPAYATMVIPPSFSEGKMAVFNSAIETWSIQDVPQEPVVNTPAIGDSSPEQLAMAVVGQRDTLLQTATLRIDPLQDAVDLGEATEAEQASLLAWKRYRVDLSRIGQQEGFPQTVVWPALPGAVENPATTA